jgi:tight adherence protein B
LPERLEPVVSLLIALLCAVGVMLMGTGVVRLQRRATTTRRVSAVLAEGPTSSSAVPVRLTPAWQGDVRQLLARFEAHDTTLRGPLLALGCACGLIGLASFAPIWLVFAGACVLGAYALGARARRLARIDSQVLDAIGLLSSGLRAGYSVPQAIALVARHSPQPTSEEFQIAAQEVSVGVTLSEAVRRLGERTANPDYELVAIIIHVQHEVGGNLAQILDSVGNTVRERFELRRQVDALTAQQRLSSLILTVLPFALLVFLFVMDRSFVDPLISQPIGRVLLALSGLMVFLGWTAMRSMGRVEV